MNVVYTKQNCPWCVEAKALLEFSNVPFETIDIEEVPSKRTEMLRRSRGRTTVPQIFLGDRHVGGYDDLAAMARRGELIPGEKQ